VGQRFNLLNVLQVYYVPVKSAQQLNSSKTPLHSLPMEICAQKPRKRRKML